MAEECVQMKLAAILVADVVGYTRMMGEDHVRTLERLRHIRDTVVEPKIAAHAGSVVKRLGDGWLASFERSNNAVKSALEIQDRLENDEFINLRIGIHWGDVSFIDEDAFGGGVNVAARLEAISAAGGIAISDAAFSALDDELRGEFEDAGRQALKNVTEPVRVWTRGGPLSTPNTTGDISDTSIRVELFSFLGDADQDDLAEDLAAGVEIELARFRWLKVIGRGHAETEQVPKARYVLGGAWRSAGNRVRVTAHLTTSSDGQRLWSDRYDRECDDPFALQDELAATLAAKTAPEIDAHEKAMARVRPVNLLGANELSLRTNEILSTGRLDGFAEADAMMARAVALEPHNASAHVQKSLVDYRKAMSGAWPARSTLIQALETAKEAVRLDQRLPGGHVMLASVHGMMGEAERSLDAAAQVEALNPNAWGASHGRSIAYAFAPPSWASNNDPTVAGLIENANETLGMASTSSFHSGHLFFAGLGLMLRDGKGDLSSAIATLKKSAAAAGATWWPMLFLALANLRQGSRSAVAEHLKQALEQFPLLSLASVEGIFGQSRVWPDWQQEFECLPELGLPEM